MCIKFLLCNILPGLIRIWNDIYEICAKTFLEGTFMRAPSFLVWARVPARERVHTRTGNIGCRDHKHEIQQYPTDIKTIETERILYNSNTLVEASALFLPSVSQGGVYLRSHTPFQCAQSTASPWLCRQFPEPLDISRLDLTKFIQCLTFVRHCKAITFVMALGL